MTLETAKRIVLEQGEKSNKEAQSVIRGGMTICEYTADGHRAYSWIKVLPTATDEESSIELAMMNHQKKKQPRKTKEIQEERKDLDPKPQKSEAPPTPLSIASEENNAPLISRFASNIKRKFNKFVKVMDEFVEE